VLPQRSWSKLQQPGTDVGLGPFGRREARVLVCVVTCVVTCVVELTSVVVNEQVSVETRVVEIVEMVVLCGN
jgi:hypothetical protein